jgi:SAM-dependent methyltransferase
MNVEQQVAGHYTHGALERAILDALAASGKDTDRLAPSDLAAVDEFHLGALPATAALADDLAFARDMHVLDVGCGIGGPARYLAETNGCRVTGIDLSAEYVAVANALTRRCGLANRAAFVQGSALALPFAEGAFDGATMIHVGMNVPDKTRLFAEVRRVLKPGARFGVYDVMRRSNAALPYPMPWAQSEATSFVADAADYRRLLAGAGFAVEREVDRSAFVLEIAQRMRETAARSGPPALGLHVLIGPSAPERLGNVMKALQAGVLAPVEIVARADS